jgi:hypothetical protein
VDVALKNGIGAKNMAFTIETWVLPRAVDTIDGFHDSVQSTQPRIEQVRRQVSSLNRHAWEGTSSQAMDILARVQNSLHDMESDLASVAQQVRDRIPDVETLATDYHVPGEVLGASTSPGSGDHVSGGGGGGGGGGADGSATSDHTQAEIDKFLRNLAALEPLIVDVILKKIGVDTLKDIWELFNMRRYMDEMDKAREGIVQADQKYGRNSPQAGEARQKYEDLYGHMPIIGSFIEFMLKWGRANPVE